MSKPKKTIAQQAAAALASLGGRSGTGASKLRGDRAYYQEIARKSAAVRAKKAKNKKNEQ